MTDCRETLDWIIREAILKERFYKIGGLDFDSFRTLINIEIRDMEELAPTERAKLCAYKISCYYKIVERYEKELNNINLP
jgi:hypothetical protein